jgi:PAS domain S-box-containing protein
MRSQPGPALRRRTKHAERVLHQSDTEYEQLFDSHPDPLWVYDQETYAFLAANAAAVRQYGWTREEFLAMKVPDLLPEEERADLMRALAMARRDQAIRHLGSGGVWTHVLKGGSHIEVEGASSPIRSGAASAPDPGHRRRHRRRLRRLIELQKMEALKRGRRSRWRPRWPPCRGPRRCD